ncbi:stage II sporulation protein P [Mangrovibacillus cuniculi]|uniref:Stage II sporulation protein P n=1 Tax=Mangrovibacillus cuniculi TaxID=2593652 RepID=A0A7S8HFK6_9BACI|nr:stage II sporulation protein P [Mangrovibacillus cuniculi]QPC46943.1 stage II sporulation protein P [Mangrovibacillus cuniculi]
MRNKYPTPISVTFPIQQMMKSIIMMLLFFISLFSLVGVLSSLQNNVPFSQNQLKKSIQLVEPSALFQLLAMENKALASAAPQEEQFFTGNQFMKLVSNVRLEDPRSFLGRELPGFSIFDSVILVAGEGTDYTNLPIESNPPADFFKGEEPELVGDPIPSEEPTEDPVEKPTNNLTTGDRKPFYIYFSHNRESFLPYLKGVTNPDLAMHSKINVTLIGDELQKQLQNSGIGSIIEKTDITGRLPHGSYGKSYIESREVVTAAMQNRKDIQYLIDIHRDAARKNVTTLTVGDKKYAKLFFVIGGKNKNYEKNAELANELHQMLEKKIPGISRGVKLQAEPGNNGIYNQDLSEKSFLIEFGGVDNTFEELNATAAVFADVLSEYYWQAEGVTSTVEEDASEQ